MEMHQLEGEMSFEKNILFPKYKQNCFPLHNSFATIVLK